MTMSGYERVPIYLFILTISHGRNIVCTDQGGPKERHDGRPTGTGSARLAL